jgi:hypothetical protein
VWREKINRAAGNGMHLAPRSLGKEDAMMSLKPFDGTLRVKARPVELGQ